MGDLVKESYINLQTCMKNEKFMQKLQTDLTHVILFDFNSSVEEKYFCYLSLIR